MTTRVKLRRQIREHARLAEMLLPPTPKNCPPYSRFYFESYRGQMFQACSNSRHRHCPLTSDQGEKHLYCVCPCHRKDLSKSAKRKMWLAIKKEMEKKIKVRTPRTPRTGPAPVAARTGSRGQQKKFRYVKAPDKIPAGIMSIVHAAIQELKEGTVVEVTTMAVSGGLAKITGQDPTSQTSIMLHRMLKSGVVEEV